jgi:hypothetical protein
MARDENGRAKWMMQFKEDYEYVDDGNTKCNANDMVVDGNTYNSKGVEDKASRNKPKH